MFILDTSGKTINQVMQIYKYMVDKGLYFEHTGFEDSSPYAILGGGSSIGYRTRSKWNKTGIVFFCTEEDKDNLVHELNLQVDDNSTDIDIPYAIFIPTVTFEHAVEVLKNNPRNI